MTLDPVQPTGFPQCPKCPLLWPGTAEVCYRCASATFETVGAPCPVCSRELDENGNCANPICNSPRFIRRVAAVAVKTGPINDRIKWLKYSGRVGWATIFGRIILGYLNAHRQPEDFDLIVANPTYVESDSNRIRHTELVIDAAAKEDLLGRWSWDTTTPRAIMKTAASLQSATGNYYQKRAAADALRSVLLIPNSSRTQGKRILVYDDVCTTGLQLDRVAEILQTRGGAAHVEGLVLARTPWRR
jgi:predicted amidophosphoribosyltransferase